MSAQLSIKVYIRNLAGEYLAGGAEDWRFIADVNGAYIFDYQADEVAKNLDQVQRDFGVAWIASPVDQKLAREKCDKCGRTMPSYSAHFDGTRFLCEGCLTGTSSSKS